MLFLKILGIYVCVCIKRHSVCESGRALPGQVEHQDSFMRQ